LLIREKKEGGMQKDKHIGRERNICKKQKRVGDRKK
jgi:hypothetical protein